MTGHGNAVMDAETRRPWVINESNTHTPDSRKACQDCCGFYDVFTPPKSFALNRANRHRLYESSSTRGTDKTPAGFHHPRCLAVGGDSEPRTRMKYVQVTLRYDNTGHLKQTAQTAHTYIIIFVTSAYRWRQQTSHVHDSHEYSKSI